MVNHKSLNMTRVRVKTGFLCLFTFGAILLNAQNNENNTSGNQYLQAQQYATGIGAARDISKAIELYTGSAAENNTQAMIALGLLYQQGIQVKMDIPLAVDWFTKAAKQGDPRGWYQLGLLYKDARDKNTRNFQKAYQYFRQAATAGSNDAVYALGYMNYKGIGAPQNYSVAIDQFNKAANLPGSMYYLGLCYRNGYGVQKNEAIARQWLQKALNHKFLAARQELDTPLPENSNQAAITEAQNIRQNVRRHFNTYNQYRKINHNVEAALIEGTYKGSIIRYDWSGAFALSIAPLELEIKADSTGKITGTWKEADSLVLPLNASLTSDNLVFQNMDYLKKDHYNQRKPLKYQFETATLDWIVQNNQLYLSGTVQMFSPQRNEPEKPLFVSLQKTSPPHQLLNNNSLSSIVKQPLLKDAVHAYPNPFEDVINLNFTLAAPAKVHTSVSTIDGKVLYEHPAEPLSEGRYRLQVKPTQTLAPGIYLLTFRANEQTKVIKVIKK